MLLFFLNLVLVGMEFIFWRHVVLEKPPQSWKALNLTCPKGVHHNLQLFSFQKMDGLSSGFGKSTNLIPACALHNSVWGWLIPFLKKKNACKTMPLQAFGVCALITHAGHTMHGCLNWRSGARTNNNAQYS